MGHTVSGLMSLSQAQALKEAIDKAATDPDYLSSVSGGGPVEKFEEAFAEAVGAKYALVLSSCTAALHVSLMAHGIGPGDEVIVSPYTWGQSVSPVIFIGAIPVFADIDPNTCTLDPKSIEERISPRTKAIIPVHIFGIPADMDTICALARKHGLTVISDAAQAFGALSKGRKLGGLGDVACYSLGRGKAVCGGEGGVLVTNNRKIYDRAIEISQHPLRVFKEISDYDKGFNDELNWNYRIHPFSVVLALADMKIVGERLLHRRMVFEAIADGLASVNELEVLKHCPGDKPAAYGVPLTYIYQSEMSREMFAEKCQKEEIDIRIGPIRTPIHLRPKIKKHKLVNQRIANFISNSCPVAVCRCAEQEIIIFDAVSADSVSLQNVKIIVEKLRNTLPEMGTY